VFRVPEIIMGLIRSIAVISVAFWVGAAHAQETSEAITLVRGETVQVSLDQGTRTGGVVTARGPAPEMPKGTQASAQLMAGMTIEEPTQEIVSLPNGRAGAPPLPINAVRFTFAQVPGSDDVVLTVENGYQRALTYRAIATVGGRRAPTDVCLVPPSRVMFEHWPYQIDSIELLELEIHDWSPGDPTPCR
jgi:hypothetical protein